MTRMALYKFKEKTMEFEDIVIVYIVLSKTALFR